MQIVIDIPEEEYEFIREHEKENPLGWLSTKTIVRNAIINGTPLPKGHGDLVDRDDVYDFLCKADAMMVCDALSDSLEIDELPTIIEADEGGVEE